MIIYTTTNKKSQLKLGENLANRERRVKETCKAETGKKLYKQQQKKSQPYMRKILANGGRGEKEMCTAKTFGQHNSNIE